MNVCIKIATDKVYVYAQGRQAAKTGGPGEQWEMHAAVPLATP